MKEQIIEIKHRLEKIASLKDYQRELERRFEENSEKLEIAYEILKKEEHDVEKLNAASFANVIAWLMKDKEERLVKEEQEARKAAVVFKQLQDENEYLNKEIVRCEEEIAKEPQLQIALETLQKEAALHGIHKEEVKPLYENLEKEQLLERELQEAIEAGYVVIEHLQDAIKEMDSASGWGVYDMIGGGIMSSMIKHSHVDHAQQKIMELQQDFLRYQKELKDVSQISLPSVSMEEWLYVADVFFDNMIFDVMALSRIHRSLEQLKDGHQTIMETQDQLLSAQCECLTRQIELKEKISSFNV